MLKLSIRQHVDRELNLEKADMRDCVEQALHEVALFLEDKRITIKFEMEPAPEGLFFDRSQMEQTLVNLLDNACKFTPRNGTIEIRGYPFFWERRNWRTTSLDQTVERRVRQIEAANSFRVDISDSGPGIPAVHAARIFEEYTSYSGGHDRSGGGLGLAICRMILQQHRGKVWAESHSAGAVFSFVLPVQPAESRLRGGQNGRAKACLARIEEGVS
jgi:signal transduction histidine kinase